jgi:hypothetical protein
MKTLTCREHGGTFQVTPGRGRPPTRCGGKWEVCSRADDPQMRAVRDMQEHAGITKARKTASPEHSARVAPDEERIRQAEKPSEPAKVPNRSVAEAMAAKAALEVQGWLCKGRGYVDEDKGQGAELMATRGEELLVMHWLDGRCINQEYTLWREKPSANAKPAHSLGFDPDECTDREIIRALSGSKVTWWNALGQFETTGVVDPEKIRIEHLYNGRGDETPGDRIIHFIDRAGGGFRAFKLAALLKVGS